MHRFRLPIAFAAAVLAQPALADTPDVVASIKPLHSIVARVMAGVGTPSLLVDGASSPHDFALKPSQAGLLENAEIVFRVGPGLETFLDKPLESLAKNAVHADLDDAPGLVVLPPREGGAFEAHDHEEIGEVDGEDAHADHDAHGADAHADHDARGESDPHLWLDPKNGALMAQEIARVLAIADPEHAATYAANAEAFVADMAALEPEIAATLAPSRGKPFIVFHDAYQYFENRFGLTAVGTITVNPEVAPGAARIAELVAKVKQTGAQCVFAEPQFDPKIVGVIAGDAAVRTAVIDPLGAALEPGPQLYATLLRTLAGAMNACLAP